MGARTMAIYIIHSKAWRKKKVLGKIVLDKLLQDTLIRPRQLEKQQIPESGSPYLL